MARPLASRPIDLLLVLAVCLLAWPAMPWAQALAPAPHTPPPADTGDRNTGDRNTGERDTGERDTGERDTGDPWLGRWCLIDMVDERMPAQAHEGELLIAHPRPEDLAFFGSARPQPEYTGRFRVRPARLQGAGAFVDQVVLAESQGGRLYVQGHLSDTASWVEDAFLLALEGDIAQGTGHYDYDNAPGRLGFTVRYRFRRGACDDRVS